MNMHHLFLYLFSGLTLVFAVGVISMRNAVRSAIFLIFTILCIAGIFFMLSAEFLGAIQILVYAGGIMVIYLFIIFLVKIEMLRSKQRAAYITAVSIGIAVLLGLEVAYLLVGQGFGPVKAGDADQLGLKSFSGELLRTYVIPFELVSLLLIGALVAAIYLARKKAE